MELIFDKPDNLLVTYVWQEDVAKISKMPGVPRNVNLTWAKTWQVGVTIYFTVLNYNAPPLRQFLREKKLLKKN